MIENNDAKRSIEYNINMVVLLNTQYDNIQGIIDNFNEEFQTIYPTNFNGETIYGEISNNDITGNTITIKTKWYYKNMDLGDYSFKINFDQLISNKKYIITGCKYNI